MDRPESGEGKMFSSTRIIAMTLGILLVVGCGKKKSDSDLVTITIVPDSPTVYTADIVVGGKTIAVSQIDLPKGQRVNNRYIQNTAEEQISYSACLRLEVPENGRL